MSPHGPKHTPYSFKGFTCLMQSLMQLLMSAFILQCRCIQVLLTYISQPLELGPDQESYSAADTHHRSYTITQKQKHTVANLHSRLKVNDLSEMSVTNMSSHCECLDNSLLVVPMCSKCFPFVIATRYRYTYLYF